MRNRKIVPLLSAIFFVLIAIGLYYGIAQFNQYQQKKATMAMIDDLFEGLECRSYDRTLDHMQWVYQDSPVLAKIQEVEQWVAEAPEKQKVSVCQKGTEMLDAIENAMILK